MKKFLLDLRVVENSRLSPNFALLKLQADEPLPDMLPGQFAEIRVDDAPNTFLRRPISINFVDKQHNTVWFLIQLVGEGTKRLATLKLGAVVNVLLPLGNGFAMPKQTDGEKGFVTQHSILSSQHFDRICCCGPKPMMISVARYAKTNGVTCEVSLENKMACGLGACLCCVENTQAGNVCVCKEGPVFNINDLLWQI